VSKAFDDFQIQLGLVDQLITIHGKLQNGQGRRYEQDSIHRAGVVLSVASWQAYVAHVLVEGLDKIEEDLLDPVTASPQWAIHAFQGRRAVILGAVKRFNTPDDVRVRDLFHDSLGFNPWPSWEWRNRRRQWDEGEMRRRTNSWVLIRHSVAHGFNLPTDIQWLQDVHGRPRLTLHLLRECKNHFTHLARITDNAFELHLRNHHNLPQPW